MSVDLQNLAKQEEFVTEQTLDTDAELVSSQTSIPTPLSRPIWKTVLTPILAGLSPVVYPL